ncbi:MAG TPA: SGNH/GDSL hydrolase family protein [Bacteroidota bacterium]|nr:SGNH/GDSL hydrolase family protein [Bacteroidota bacterium]
MKSSHVITVFLAVLLVSGINGCADKAPGPVASLGSLTISSYVAVGNSLTAGFQSNALYESSQKYSYPNLIHAQLNASGGTTTFVQPLWSDPGTPIAGTSIAAQYEILSLVGPKIGPAGRPAGAPENLSYPAPYNNLAVPGAFIFDFLNATNENNCYTAIFAASPNKLFTSTLRSGGSQFTQTIALKPDLVTFWLGNNDVLGYATAGGTVPFTPPGTFAGLYGLALDSLRVRAGTKTVILVGNIPDVTSIPFFKTIPSQGLVLRQGQADSLNAATGNAFHFTAGANGFLAVTGTGVKKLGAHDFVLLTCSQDSLKLAGWGSLKPIPNQYVLDSVEAAAAKSTVAAYNAAITAAATAQNAVVVDINSVLANIAANGVMYAGQELTADYVVGGVFSLDGVHPTSKGQGLIANEFIRAMNMKLGTNIPFVDIGSLPGIPAPLSKYEFGGRPVPYYSPDALKALQLQWF